MREFLNILLVDDDEDEYVLLKQLISNASQELGQTQFNLDWVETYAEALEAYEKQEYDAYLVDYHLGDFTGLDLTAEAVQRGLKAPIILLTGQGSYNIDLAAMEAGAADYLVKSELNLPLLERSIRYAIEQKMVQDRLEEMVEERTRELRLTNTELQAEVTRRRLVEQGLRESETRFRTLADTTSAAIFIVQGELVQYANPAARIITGYTQEELVGHKLWQIIHPTYQGVLKNHGLAAGWATGYPARYELKILTKTGEERWVDLSAGEIALEGSQAWVLTAFDITERDLAERELRKAKEELELRVAERTQALRQANARLEIAAEDALRKAEEISAVFDAMVEAVTVVDAHGFLVTANRVAVQGLGIEPKGMHLGELLDSVSLCSPDGRPFLEGEDPIGRALMGETISAMRVLLTADQQQVHATVSASPLYDQDRLIGAVGVWQDVSERENLMEELEAERARLRTIIEVAPAAIMFTDPEAHILLANPAAEHLLSEPDETDSLLRSPERMNLFTPEGARCRPQDNILVRASSQGESHSDVEMLVHTPAGERRVLLGSAIPVHDRKGQLTGAVGLFQDITRRKQAEEETQRRARELDALHQAASTLMGTLELDELLSKILTVVCDAIPPAEKGLLHLILPTNGELLLAAASGFAGEDEAELAGLLERTLPPPLPAEKSSHAEGSPSISAPGEVRTPLQPPDNGNNRVKSRARRSHPGYPGKVVREKRPLVIPNLCPAGEEPRLPELLEGPIPSGLRGARSLVAVPLLHREECLGVLALASSAQEAFDELDLRLLESFAATASAAIENARLYAQVQRLSMTDTLTELYNRRGLRVVGQREIERARRFGRPVAAVMLDIDYFKKINDSHGHSVGDEVLRSLAFTLRSMVRRVDVVARYGGEEFAIILPENTLTRAVDMAQRIREYFAANSILTSAGPLNITVSAGVSEVDNCVLDLDELIDCADRALYKAKSSGRNRVSTQ